MTQGKPSSLWCRNAPSLGRFIKTASTEQVLFLSLSYANYNYLFVVISYQLHVALHTFAHFICPYLSFYAVTCLLCNNATHSRTLDLHLEVPVSVTSMTAYLEHLAGPHVIEGYQCQMCVILYIRPLNK